MQKPYWIHPDNYIVHKGKTLVLNPEVVKTFFCKFTINFIESARAASKCPRSSGQADSHRHQSDVVLHLRRRHQKPQNDGTTMLRRQRGFWLSKLLTVLNLNYLINQSLPNRSVFKDSRTHTYIVDYLQNIGPH